MKRFNSKNVTSVLMLAFFAVFVGSLLSSCKKEDPSDDDDDDDDKKAYVLIIENGAQKITPDQSLTYKSVLVDEQGHSESATGVTWTSSATSIATISDGGAVSVVAQGMVTVKAQVTFDGVTYTAEAPLGIYAPALFTVAPAAILYEVGGDLQLEAIHLSLSGVNEPTCSYQTSDASVASVSSAGLVTFNKIGSCVITVTATNLDGSPQCFVPVTVIGPIAVELPVIRVEVTPSVADLFRNETAQLSATAYNFDGDLVTGKTATWHSADEAVVTVNASGLVTPVNPGETSVFATINGIMGQAFLTVNPDTMVVVEPFRTSIAAGATKQFTAKAYHLTRTNATEIPGIAFDWMIPTYGFSMFDIATVSNTGLVSMKNDAMAGMMTMVVATVNGKPETGGAASIIAAIADECDCGDDNPTVASISVNQNTFNLNLMTSPSANIIASALDSNGNTVSNAQIVFCSDNISCASVDSDGTIMAVGDGTANIKLCVGSISKTITINVTLF